MESSGKRRTTRTPQTKIKMKPKIVPFYETSSGTPVKTLAEWKSAELTTIFSFLNAEAVFPQAVVGVLIDKASDVIAILSAKELGRPLNRKDGAPRVRKPKVVPTAA